MPGKYSHALVLANYEYRGLIDPTSYHTNHHHHSPSPSLHLDSSTPVTHSSHLSPSPPSPPPSSSHSPPSLEVKPHFSRSSTPKPATSPRPNGIPEVISPSIHLRSSSATRSISSRSTESSSHAASSVVTQIYAPLRPITSSSGVNQRRRSISATTPPVSARGSESHSHPSPQTSHTRSNHSSSPRSNTTAKTSINSTSLTSSIPEKAVDEDEIYFGSDEESDGFSTVSSPSSSRYIIKPWEHPDLRPGRFQFNTHYSPDSDDSRASSPSRQRGSSPDDAAPPPIARYRRVEFAEPSISPKPDLPSAKRASIIRRLSFLRPALSLSLSLPQRRSLSHSAPFSTGPPMSVSYIDTAPGPIPMSMRESETPKAEAPKVGHLEPVAKPWQASTFDISWMDETERNKLRKKRSESKLEG